MTTPESMGNKELADPSHNRERRLIKRYSNRKLYDTATSGYVTLEEIAQMIQTGDAVQVVDNKSGDDLTSVTFAQIIFEAEKKQSLMPLGLLRSVIERQGGLLEHIRSPMEQVQEKTAAFMETADRVRDGLGDVLDGLWRRGDRDLRSQLSTLSQFISASEQVVQQMQETTETAVKGRIHHLAEDVQQLRKQLKTIENRLRRTKIESSSDPANLK